jgi:hypothetical protein
MVLGDTGLGIVGFVPVEGVRMDMIVKFPTGFLRRLSTGTASCYALLRLFVPT